MDINNRISKINEKIAINTYAINQYRESLKLAVDSFIESMDAIDEASINTINIIDPRFTDRDFILSINSMNYDELQETQKSLESLLESIVMSIESRI